MPPETDYTADELLRRALELPAGPEQDAYRAAWQLAEDARQARLDVTARIRSIRYQLDQLEREIESEDIRYWMKPNRVGVLQGDGPRLDADVAAMVTYATAAAQRVHEIEKGDR